MLQQRASLKKASPLGEWMASTERRNQRDCRFFRAGGFDQTRIDSGADIAGL